jgi:GntR family transcriptional regulator of abcA and norABC
VQSHARRLRLLDLAYRFRIPILEDDVYGDLWYDTPPPPPLRSLDRHGFVLYAGSFSKMLCPGLRVGWIAAPRLIVRRLAQAKQLMDLQAPTLSQMIVERVLDSGQYAEHAEQARRLYALRRTAMDEALRSHGHGWAEWQVPAGGFYYWCRLAPPLGAAALAVGAAEKDVSILPGAACIAGESTANFVRLSFSCVTPAQIELGIARLGRVARRLESHTREADGVVNATRPVI